MRRISPNTFNIYKAVSLLAAGLILIVLSAVIIFKTGDISFGETEATIVRIEEEYNYADDEKYYTVFVDYEVDGVRYKDTEYGAYDSSMKVGDKVIAMYDVENPEFIQAEGSEKVPYILGGIGLLAVAVGVFILVKAIRKS